MTWKCVESWMAFWEIYPSLNPSPPIYIKLTSASTQLSLLSFSDSETHFSFSTQFRLSPPPWAKFNKAKNTLSALNAAFNGDNERCKGETDCRVFGLRWNSVRQLMRLAVHESCQTLSDSYYKRKKQRQGVWICGVRFEVYYACWPEATEWIIMGPATQMLGELKEATCDVKGAFIEDNRFWEEGPGESDHRSKWEQRPCPALYCSKLSDFSDSTNNVFPFYIGDGPKLMEDAF
nr:hypothetical protein Iba_chr02eCG10570 [Ipomoea batatas]